MQYQRLTLSAWLLVAFLNICQSQTSLNNVYDWGTGKQRYLNFWDVVYDRDSLTVFGEVLDKSIPGHQNPFLARFDTLGNLGRLVHFFDPIDQLQNLTSEFSRINQTSDGGYIFTSGAFGRFNNIILYKTDSLFNIEFCKEYPLFNCTAYDRNILETSDAYYIGIDLCTFQGNSHDYCIVKTDKQGNKLWQKLYGISWQREKLSVIKSFNEGEITLFGIPRNTNFSLMVIDTAGEIIRNYLLNPTNNVTPMFEIDTIGNGDFITLGYNILDFNLYISESWIFRFDSTGKEVWATQHGGINGFNTLFRMIKDSDDTFIAGGMDILDDTVRAVAVRFNTDGEILWRSYFGAHTIRKHPYFQRTGIHGLAQLPGGNVLACGTMNNFDDAFRSVGFLLKISPDGCIDTLCSSLLSDRKQVTATTPEVYVWPNPAREVLYVEVPPGYSELSFVLYDLYGRRVHSQLISAGQNELLISSLFTNGVYFYQVKGSRGILHKGKLILLTHGSE